MLHSFMSCGFAKIKGSDRVPASPRRSYELYTAKNGIASCQISFLSEEDMPGLRLSAAGPDNGVKITLYRQNMLEIGGDRYPDPLSPFTGELDLRSGVLDGVMILLSVPADCAAGTYGYELALSSGGKTVETYRILLHVWDFAYAATPVMTTAVVLDRKALAYVYGYTEKYHAAVPEGSKEEVDRLYKIYYDYLLENKLSAYHLPYDILDDRADAYMSDPRVTNINIDHALDDETLRRIYEKLMTDPDWIAKANLYPVDEPKSVEMMEEIKEKAAHYRKICPNIRLATSFFMDADYDENTDEIDFLADQLDILCLKVKCWHDPAMYSERQRQKYPPVADRTRALKEKGKKIWSYVCWEPRRPFLNVLIDEPGIDHRILFWQQYSVGSQGFLYWNVNFWQFTDRDPWTCMATVPWLSREIYGDGSLLYNGNKYGVDGPCPSKRFIAVREGIEDCELLTVAERVLGKEWVDREIARVTTGILSYTEDNDLFEEVRRDIGNGIEAALAARGDL